MVKLKSLNKWEVLIGTIFGACFFILIGWWALALAPVTGYLWAAGGAKKEDGGNKLYRRFGCSALPVLAVYLVSGNWGLWWGWITLPLAWWDLATGYGLPSTQPSDPGSRLGRWAFKVMKGDEKKAEILCRAILYVWLAVCFIPCWFVAKKKK